MRAEQQKEMAGGKGRSKRKRYSGKGERTRQRPQRRAIHLVKGAPVHGPQLNGCGSDNGSRPWGLKQQSCVPKHPARLHVNLDLATFNLQVKASLQVLMPPYGVGP